MSITSDLDDSSDLRELFVTLYIRYIKNAFDRGLFYKYEEQTEDCTVIKGKVDLRDYFTRKFPNGQPDKFSCTHSNFEFDNTLNRIIKFTCKSLLPEASKSNQKHIRHILVKLNDVSDVRCTPHDCDTIRLSRLHKHYSISIPLILDDYGIRKITPYECLALQGFPKEYRFPKIPMASAYKQCGNSVVVPVIRRIAENIKQVY